MTNQTVLKFGYPESLIGETEHWAVLLRPKQITAGCLVLACKEDATSFGQISARAGTELPVATQKLETCLNRSFQPEKFNYLALMMVDPHVHFHVIPRYSAPKKVDGTEIPDSGWPKHPAMGNVAPLSEQSMQQLRELLRSNWPA